MVHALSEIRRGLVRDGILIDVRPLIGQASIEMISKTLTRLIGHVDQLPEDLADDEAANRAMEEAVHCNWFVREREVFFPILYIWDSPAEMQKYVEEDWSDYVSIDESVLKNIRSMWAVEGANAHLRITLKMLIARCRVLKEN